MDYNYIILILYTQFLRKKKEKRKNVYIIIKILSLTLLFVNYINYII